VGLKDASPAQILEKILSDSWTLQPEDKDMIVMYHKFGLMWCKEANRFENGALAKTKLIQQWLRQSDCRLQWRLCKY
jgi:hypothetical protein